MPSRLRSGALSLLIGIAICCNVETAQAVYRSPWRFGAELSFLSNDNITGTFWPEDIKEDTVYLAGINGSYAFSFSQSQALILGAAVRKADFQDYSGLSNRLIDIDLEYRFKTRLGFTAPVYSLYMRKTDADYETQLRDGDISEYGFRIHRPMTDRISINFTARNVEQSANSEVFNLKRTQFTVGGDYRLSRRWLLYASYDYIDGDVNSITRRRANEDAWADVWVVDDAFMGLAPPLWAYRIDAKTDRLQLGLNFGINHDNALDISYENIDSDAAGPIYYKRNVASLSYIIRF